MAFSSHVIFNSEQLQLHGILGVPEAAEIELEKSRVTSVTFVDDRGRDVPLAAPLEYRLAKVDRRFVVYCAAVGQKWSDAVVIRLGA